jgi:hypothetical protein
MARPSRLTPKLCERIVHELADGVPVNVTAQRVGVPVRTLHSWLAAGKVERRQRPDPLTIAAQDPETPDLENRLRQAEGGLLAVVLGAAQRGSWQAAMRLLEAIDPQRWGRQPRQPPAMLATPPPPTSREREQVADLFAEIDELAARRARART